MRKPECEYFNWPPRSQEEREVYEYRVETNQGAYYAIAKTPQAAEREVNGLYPGVTVRNVAFSGRRFTVTPEGTDYQTLAEVTARGMDWSGV